MQDESPPLRTDAEAIGPLLEPLLGVHSATTAGWLADAAATAAERGLGALYSLLYLVDASGDLAGERPASTARMRRLAKLNQDLGTDLTTFGFTPSASLAVASAMKDGHAAAVREVGHALPLSLSPEELQTAQRSLGISRIWLAPLFWDGESLGVMVLFLPDEASAALSEAELLGHHVAVALRNLREREAGRRRGEIDSVRWVFDQQRLEEELGVEIHRARRHQRPLSIMLLRVDNFPALRARYGRFLAERLLRQVGSELETAMRDTDFLGAFREDGFAAILVEADQDAAQLARTRLTAGLTNVHLPNAGLDELHVHLSCATATTPEDGETPEELSAAAEARLNGEAASIPNAASA